MHDLWQNRPVIFSAENSLIGEWWFGPIRLKLEKQARYACVDYDPVFYFLVIDHDVGFLSYLMVKADSAHNTRSTYLTVDNRFSWSNVKN
jgi:hypothetical protein